MALRGRKTSTVSMASIATKRDVSEGTSPMAVEAYNELMDTVEDLMWPAVVYDVEIEFGLRYLSGTADEPENLIGGWLTTYMGKKRTKLHFYTLEVDKGLLRQNNNEDHRGNKFIKFNIIQSIEPMVSDAGVKVIHIVHDGNPKSGGKGELKLRPLGNHDETVCRWVAALRYYCGERMIPKRLIAAAHGAERVAEWGQSLVLRDKAIAKVARMKERRKGVMATIGYWWNGSYDDSDSDFSDDDSDGGEGETNEPDEEGEPGMISGASTFFVSIASAVMTDLYSNALGYSSAIPEETPATKLLAPSTSGKKRLSIRKFSKKSSAASDPSSDDGRPQKLLPVGSYVEEMRNIEEFRREKELKATESTMQLRQKPSQARAIQAFELPALRRSEVEDEVWENQRWVVRKGWGGSGHLLPTDRKPFTDRTGRIGHKELQRFQVPAAWKLTVKFTVDTSGVGRGQCDDEGWMYQIDNGPLDTDLARGSTHAIPDKTHVVRRRRWYCRRIPDFLPPAGYNPIIYEGWLGQRNTSNHRWVSRYFVLSRGLNIGGQVTGVCLTYFRQKYKKYDEYRHSQDFERWTRLTKRRKAVRTIRLDDCIVSEDVATMAHPGWFSVKLADERDPRYFNAGTAVARDEWISRIRRAVREQVKQFTLSRTLRLPLNGALGKVPRFENTVLDRLLPINVDSAVSLLFFDDELELEVLKDMKAASVLIHPWTKGVTAGSRREISYIAPSDPANRLPETDVLVKYKLVDARKGEGYHVDSSKQMFKVQFGGIYQIEMRYILLRWEANHDHSRLIISQRVNIRTQDEDLRTFISSTTKSHVLEYYSTQWLPCVKSIMRTRLEEQVRNRVQVVSPSGMKYNLPEQEVSMKDKVLSVFGGIATNP